MIRHAVISGLLASGCTPIDLDICPVPSLQFAVANSDSVGGIAISAGHNPEDWNALKFIRHDGLYLNAGQGDELLDIFHHGVFDRAPWNEIKPHLKSTTAIRDHINAIVAAVDSARIRKAGFKVAIDACNGACSQPALELLEVLGCETAAISCEPGETFPHDPEPKPSNMKQLRALVRATGFDAGFMLDTAGERLGIVTDEGESLPEELTLTMCAAIRSARKPGPIVTNLSTTRAIDDIAKKHKVQVVRTPIGQAYVAEAALKHRAAIAGEGSGGVIFPDIQYANDGLAAVAFILDHLARQRTSISKLVSTLPKYVTIKKNIPLDYTLIFKVIQHVRLAAERELKKCAIDLTDGIKINWENSWLHIRPSNTESLIRLIVEAKTEKRAEELIALGEELITR